MSTFSIQMNQTLRKRRKSESSTPPITKFFPILKRQRSPSEEQRVSQKLDNSEILMKGKKENADDESPTLEYNSDELCGLLEVNKRTSKLGSVLGVGTASLENLPNEVQTRLYTILDLHSLSCLALTSKTMSKNVKMYVTAGTFYRRFHLDFLDFVNCSHNVHEGNFIENDPFFACGILIKSLTITLDTDKRTLVFLNICRNLFIQMGGDIHGFGRIVEGMAQCWTFSERRLLVKAAILIDPRLRNAIVNVLTGSLEEFIGLEMKVRSCLTELFLNRRQDVDECSTDEIIEFGSWLSILLKNFTEQYQGKLYYLLFGPTVHRRTGEKVAWNYFSRVFEEDVADRSTNRNRSIVKMRMTNMLNGIKALRIMSTTRQCDISWTSRKIYRLFLRIVECSSIDGEWPMEISAMALAIDTSGLFSEYLFSCCDVHHSNFVLQQEHAANMICQVRSNLFIWNGSPSTFLSEPLHFTFNELAKIDGHPGGPYYSAFLDRIWQAHYKRIDALVEKGNTRCFETLRIEMNAQLAILRILSHFADAVAMYRYITFEDENLNMENMQPALIEREEQEE
ncbi:unnamed protein product [Caenorhabditis bovis]|uniref:F-box domain-containing protein n=1 Tax=Caenorhabditis bovis TaxID=2654633 RepID=A0A8S1EP87_9PELO|nr:unnamed protein product [Caenorhabditis bovis]